MKRIFLLLLPVFFFFSASAGKGGCCKKVVQVHDTITVLVHDTIHVRTIVHDTIYIADKPVGPPTSPARVWDEFTTGPISGAVVVALDLTNIIESATTDAQGNYSFTKLLTGKSYTYKVNKTGYTSQTATAAYSGTVSLPEFKLRR